MNEQHARTLDEELERAVRTILAPYVEMNGITESDVDVIADKLIDWVKSYKTESREVTDG